MQRKMIIELIAINAYDLQVMAEEIAEEGRNQFL